MGHQVGARAMIDGKTGGTQVAGQRCSQSAQRRRRLAAPGPQDAALGPEAEPVQAQVNGLGAYPAGDFFKTGNLCGRHRADEGQRQVQRRRTHHPAATAGSQFVGQRRQMSGRLGVRPQRKKDTVRARLAHASRPYSARTSMATA